jgi:hypothetical protein
MKIISKEAALDCVTNDNAKITTLELSEKVLVAGTLAFTNSSTDFDDVETIVARIFESMALAMTYEEFQNLSAVLITQQPDASHQDKKG